MTSIRWRSSKVTIQIREEIKFRHREKAKMISVLCLSKGEHESFRDRRNNIRWGCLHGSSRKIPHPDGARITDGTEVSAGKLQDGEIKALGWPDDYREMADTVLLINTLLSGVAGLLLYIYNLHGAAEWYKKGWRSQWSNWSRWPFKSLADRGWIKIRGILVNIRLSKGTCEGIFWMWFFWACTL